MKKYTILKDGTYRDNETGFAGIKPGNWMFDNVVEWLSKGNTPDFEINELSKKIALAEVRKIRNEKLAETDFMLFPDYLKLLNSTQKEQLLTYRQQLRDITKNCNLVHVIWPEKPDFIKG